MFEKIKNKVVETLWWNGPHDIDHTMRVHDMCVYIWKKEWANLEILQIAALLHDIGRPKQHETMWKICHAEYWSILAKQILKEMWYKVEKIEQVIHCISTHRFRKWNAPETLEAKVLFDADKLDSIWAVWIWRAFMYANEVGAKLHNEEFIDVEKTEEHWPEDTAFREYLVKLIKVKDKLFTKTAKKLAVNKQKIMIKFFDNLNEETWWIKKLVNSK